MQESELISVVVPTYNRAHLILETIRSVIDQHYQNWELIIVDDGSTDDTARRISELKEKRIRYYAIEHCGVISKVRNTGLHHARGEYIAFLDSDDLWERHKLDYQLSLLKKHPQASFVFGHGEQFGNGATPTPRLENLFIGNVLLPFLLEERFIFYVPALLFKKEICNKIKWIDESLSGAGDIDFFLRMAHGFDGVFSNEIVVKIRKHRQSHSKDYELQGYDEYLIMLNKFSRDGLLNRGQFKQIASKYHYKLGLLYLKWTKPKRAVKEFIRHIYLKPLSWKGWARLAQAVKSGISGAI